LASWADRLPFVLGSIVRRYMIEEELRGKLESALHFFEAVAIFGAATLLGVLERSEKERQHVLEKLRDPAAPDPFREGSLGSWINLGRMAAKALRTRYNDAIQSRMPPAALREGFGLTSPLFLKMLVNDTEAWNIIDEARILRNDRAHGGVLEGRPLSDRVEQVERLLDRFREISDRPLSSVRLLLVGPAIKKGGLRHFHHTKVLLGTNSQFAQMRLTMPAMYDLNATDLILIDDDSADTYRESAIVLPPLIQLRASPDSEPNAAYYFNRRQPGGRYKFVSYHFSGEVEEPIESVALTSFLKSWGAS